jgi:hypothetical protein
MVAQQSVCLRRLGTGRAGEMRFGRFLRNERVTLARLIEGVCAGIGARSAGRHVLAIEDTSELNYQAHAGRVAGLGTVGNGADKGLFMHPVLAVDADDGACLGLAQLHLWQRSKAKAANYKSLPIEDKESARWISAAQQARQRMPQARKITVIADRESDIYEMWERLPDARTELLIRACHDRRLGSSAGQPHDKLFDWLAQLPIAGSERLALAATARRSAHEALLHVRFGATRLQRPKHCTDPKAEPAVGVYAIDVLEDASTVVGKEKPIHWRLLTTHRVQSLHEARQCIAWYRQRWHIEQLFRTLKRQGLNIESSLVEDAKRLEKLAVLAACAASTTLQLTLAREGRTQRPASDVFDAQALEVLAHIAPTLEGKTQKQKNPHAPASLAWAGWIVARLGGWKGYASERKPGPITMVHGLQVFEAMARGWILARRR